MLRRKIENGLLKWKRTAGKKPLVIKGIRQCGKTFIVKQFARDNYKSVVYTNFVLEPDKADAFNGNKDVDTIVMNLSALIPGSVFIPGETCIILDEIQDCPAARTSLKSFKEDGRFDVIATGSLLGVKGYGKDSETDTLPPDSVPVGYETTIDMFPLDFEEFLWACGISEAVTDEVRRCYREETPVPEGIHTALMKLLHRYVVTGGLPEVVNTFLDTSDIGQVYKVQRELLNGYEEDMVKYAKDRDKPRIRECFESIPKQLARENKKFQYSMVKKGGRSSEYTSCLQWLEDAGIIRRCYNVRSTELPLEGNAIDDCFKVYVSDIGILMSMLDFGSQADILQGNLLGYKGAIFENLVADFFGKAGRNLYYFHKDSGLELDFLIRMNGKCTPVEVKATTGKAKSLNTVLRNNDVYHVDNALKFGNYNVGRSNGVLSLPLYMGFLLEPDLTDTAIPKVDLTGLTDIPQ